MNISMLKKSQLILVAGLMGVALAYQNCSDVKVSKLSSDAPLTTQSLPNYSVSIAPNDGYVCSPFGSVVVPSDKSGLKTELRYIPSTSSLTAGDKNNILSTKYFDDADPLFVKVPERLYLQDVNVPTRRFESGFSTADGTLIKDTAGNVLIEYFALKMDSLLKLGPNDMEGEYEIATLSDDGTVLQIQENGQWINLIGNDGAHSTRMGCNSHRIAMTKASRVPMRLYYNQGPRTEIANVMMWNLRSGSGFSDTEIHQYCNQADSNLFWNASNSQPNTAVNYLLSKSWKILTADNFQLPDNEVNPCSYNKYELNPVLVGQDGKDFDLTLAEAASISVNAYKKEANGSKTLVKTLQQIESLHHNFSVEGLSMDDKYLIEITMSIQSKQVRVLKEYNIQFAPL